MQNGKNQESNPNLFLDVMKMALLDLGRSFALNVSAELKIGVFEEINLKCLNKKTMANLTMPTSRRFKKNQNQQKAQYNKPTRKNKSKIYLTVGIIAVAAVVVAAFLVVDSNNLFSTKTATSEYSPNGPFVTLTTTMGNITIQLRTDKPITTANFINLTKMGIYDNTIFHRVMAGFMIQGGDPTGTGYGSPSIATIPDEIGKDNVNSNGTIAMANTGQPGSASSQFFINVADNQNLYSTFDTSYTVFGRVTQGMNVVMAISQVPVNSTSNRPLQNVTITQAQVLP